MTVLLGRGRNPGAVRCRWSYCAWRTFPGGDAASGKLHRTSGRRWERRWRRGRRERTSRRKKQAAPGGARYGAGAARRRIPRRAGGGSEVHGVLEVDQQGPEHLELATQVGLGIGVQDLEVVLQVRVHLLVQEHAHVAVLLVDAVGDEVRGAVVQVQRRLQLQRTTAAVLLAVVEVQARVQAVDHEVDLRV